MLTPKAGVSLMMLVLPLGTSGTGVESVAMRFQGRELKPYAEPVSASELKEGVVYFAVNFVDSEKLIPEMTPLVFVGRNLDADDVGRVYFQDLDSYRRGIRYGSSEHEGDAEFFTGSENEVKHIFEYERALDVLLSCSLRRSNAESGEPAESREP